MASFVGTPALSRRLTQLFSDNKRTYEALVQQPSIQQPQAPEWQWLQRKLRIQKDRLVTWGVSWSDRSAASKDSDNIDGLLDRAGLGDLVASIMSSIKELLDEAESLQPQANPISQSRASGKAALLAPRRMSREWTPEDVTRLEEIIKDLTTSIDTLCDLSRSRIEGSPPQELPPSPSKPAKVEAMKAPVVRPVSMDAKGDRNTSPARRDDLTDMTYIDPSMLKLRAAHMRNTSSPPSYESVAAGSENRVLAYFSLPSARPKDGLTVNDDPSEIAVLLDYRQNVASSSRRMPRPDGERFEELLLALLQFSKWKANSYTGILKLNGWTVDRQKTRFAYVYEVPRPIGTGEGQASELQPRSLLSFLQNATDADTLNMPCLENRFRLALNLSLSLMRLHEMNVTHRNVNSSNVLFFIEPQRQRPDEKVWRGPLIRKPFLTGLHQLAANFSTYDRESPFSGIYYHPKLTGSTPITYGPVHDYYSLGLTLLEIGLWMPIGKFWKSKYTVDDFKSRLQDIYLPKLSGKCGESYMQAVLYCLIAAENLDTTSVATNGSADEHQVNKFQENAIRRLERCCLIDSELKHDEIIEPFAADPAAEQSYMSLESSISQDIQVSQDAATNPDQVGGVDVAPPKSPTPSQKIKVWSHDIPELYSQYWTSTMFPKLEKILRKALSRWESYTIDLFMAGEHQDTARPTIYIECASTAKVRKILRHLNKDLRLFDIKVVAGQISRSKANHKKRKTKKPQSASSSNAQGAVEDLNPCYRPEPGFGASIGAYKDGSHLPPVTFGGAVLVDGEPYGMSVHHMLEDDEDMQMALRDAIDLHRSMAAPQTDSQALKSIEQLQSQISSLYPFEVTSPGPAADDASSVGYTSSDGSGVDFSPATRPEAIYPFELDGEDDGAFDEGFDEANADDEFWLRNDFDDTSTISDDDEELDMGDTDGISPGEGEALLVTQPALDDVKEGFFPCPEDAEFEHLTSHTLGYVHASSGLRRARYDSFVHEVDWALIKINLPRLPGQTSLNQPPTSPTGFLCPRPTQILPCDSLASRAVHSHARSSGLFARGMIMPSMQMVRMPGRISPSHSWQVRGDFGPGGDSGAWVFDDATGAVCGHVLAHSERSGLTYIAPMDVMVRDMERVLGKKVQLPGEEIMPQLEYTQQLEVGGNNSGTRATKSPVVPTSPPVLPRYDGGQGERTVVTKGGRASPSRHGVGVHAG